MGEKKFQVNPDVIMREIAGEVILVPVGKATEALNGLASLNETGAFLWRMLGEKRSLAELSSCLVKEYELTEEEGLRDVSEFLALAEQRKLVLCYE